MDRRDFLKDLGILTLGGLLLPKGRSMVGWTRAVESPLYLHKSYGMGFMISREMLEDDMYSIAEEDLRPGSIVSVKNNLVRIVRPDYDMDSYVVDFVQPNKWFHRETSTRKL